MRFFYPWLLLLPAGCGPADKPAAESTPKAISTPKPLAPVFDIPTLATQSIDQINAALGPALKPNTEPTKQEISEGIVEWGKKYQRDSTTLLVTYDVKTRQVIDFYLSTAHGPTTDYAPLLQLAHISAQDPHWSVEPFAMPGHPQLYLGVRIAPK